MIAFMHSEYTAYTGSHHLDFDWKIKSKSKIESLLELSPDGLDLRAYSFIYVLAFFVFILAAHSYYLTVLYFLIGFLDGIIPPYLIIFIQRVLSVSSDSAANRNGAAYLTVCRLVLGTRALV